MAYEHNNTNFDFAMTYILKSKIQPTNTII